MPFPCLLYSQVHPCAKFWPMEYGKSNFQVVPVEGSEGMPLLLPAGCIVDMVGTMWVVATLYRWQNDRMEEAGS